MVRRGIRRRFRRRRLRRGRIRPASLLRKSRRLRKIGFRKIQRKKQRKNRKIKKNVWGYMDGHHQDCGFNETRTFDVGTVGVRGLGSRSDMNEIFQQVRQIDDLIYAAQTGLGTGQMKANRGNLKINVQARQTVTISSDNEAGGIFCQVYILKCRRGITTQGIGTTGSTDPGDVFNNNTNSRYLSDYNDASALTISSFGTAPPVNNVIVNTQQQAKPTVASSDHWTTPFMVPEFTRNYKVLKVHKFFLPPNGNFMFTMKLPLTTVTRNDYEISNNALNGGLAYIPKFNRLAVVRFHGQPVNDTTTESKVNYAKAALNIVIDKKYEFSYGSQPSYFNVQFPSFLTTVAGANLPGDPPQPVGEVS